MKKGNQKGDERKNKKRPGEEKRGSALCLQCTRLSNFGLVHSPTSTALHPSHAFSLLLRIPFQAGERNAACQKNGAEESGKGRGSERAALNISTQKTSQLCKAQHDPPHERNLYSQHESLNSRSRQQRIPCDSNTEVIMTRCSPVKALVAGRSASCILLLPLGPCV